MNTDRPETQPMEEPLAELERLLIDEYLGRVGESLHTLLSRGDEEARKLLAEASVYAAGRLTEIESRSDYLRHLRGEG